MRELPEKIGRYQVLCELGVGGMATVYLGRSEGLGDFERLFAIKMIHANLCELPEFLSLFLNEARIAARIHHPHVVPVYEIDMERDQYFLSMDYVSGETLSLALQRTWNEEKPFPIDVAAHTIACAADGLHAAHELEDADGDPLGVVHRDVTPQNIIMGYDGIVRVMDFGIAKALDTVSLTQPGTWRGSVPYLSPEQVQHSGEIDRRADIFALGVVLWETTVGQRLFRHTTDIGTVARILNMEIPAPSSLRDDYPEALEAIVMKALARDREDRFDSAEEMSEALRHFLVDQGICATARTIKTFMAGACGERMVQRRAMERDASSVLAPGPIESLPPLEDPANLMSSVKLQEEPIDNPTVARRITEITVRPVTESVALGAPVPAAEFEDIQQETEVAESPLARKASRPKAPPRPPTHLRGARQSLAPALIVAAAILVAGGAIAMWPRPQPVDELLELPDEEQDENLAAGSVSVSDMAGDGGKPGTVVFYFRTIPANARIEVDGAPMERDLVVPRSRMRYSVRFAADGYHPQLVAVTAEASRLIEASLKPIQKPKKKRRRRRRRR